MKIKDITMKSSKEVAVLEQAVNFLNKNLFDNQLSNIKVTIAPDTNYKNLSYGWASLGRWNNGKQSAHELNITANSLKRPFKEIWITLIHELIHIYAFCKGDSSGATSRQGRYHGKEFKTLCDKFYLITEKNTTIGYVTPHCKMLKEQKELYSKFSKSCNYNLAQLFKYVRTMNLPIKGKTKSTSSKYVCSSCGLEFKAKKGLNVVCGVCDVPFEEIES